MVAFLHFKKKKQIQMNNNNGVLYTTTFLKINQILLSVSPTCRLDLLSIDNLFSK